jgi:hypothetical protein
MAAPWERSYVVSAYEPAFYYGGKVGTEDVGTDCPKGLIAEDDYKVLLNQSWRTPQELARLTAPLVPGGRDPRSVRKNAMAHRGFRPDIETYINPMAAPDPGMQQVTGKIAIGFNLDNKAGTGGFTSPSGERGIDNAFYRAFGCAMSYRGEPYHAYLSQRANDKMLEGLYTFVIRVSGNQDPMNDTDAVVEVGYSPDHIVKNSMGNVAVNYSFRIAKSAQYTRLRATIKNGTINTEQVANLDVPAFAWYEANRGGALFKNGRMRMVMNQDGSLSGILGGYRDWRDIYAKDTFNAPSGGESRETTYRQNQIAFYYALKRNADALPDPKTGQNMGISATYRFEAKPAFVVVPETPVVIDQPPLSPMADRQRVAFYKALTTKQISAPPARAGTGTAPAAPNGNAFKSADDKQVNNATPATVASATP